MSVLFDITSAFRSVRDNSCVSGRTAVDVKVCMMLCCVACSFISRANVPVEATGIQELGSAL